MKKMIVLATLALSLAAFAAPVTAAPNDNADPRAFLAQHINYCRSHMAASGEMGRDQINACLSQMKDVQCPCLSGSAPASCAH